MKKLIKKTWIWAAALAIILAGALMTAACERTARTDALGEAAVTGDSVPADATPADMKESDTNTDGAGTAPLSEGGPTGRAVELNGFSAVELFSSATPCEQEISFEAAADSAARAIFDVFGASMDGCRLYTYYVVSAGLSSGHYSVTVNSESYLFSSFCCLIDALTGEPVMVERGPCAPEAQTAQNSSFDGEGEALLERLAVHEEILSAARTAAEASAGERKLESISCTETGWDFEDPEIDATVRCDGEYSDGSTVTVYVSWPLCRVECIVFK